MTTNAPIPFQASKWLQLPTLLSAAELRELFVALGDFSLYLTGRVVEKDKGLVERDWFLEQYASYVDTLKEGNLPNDAYFRPLFSLLVTTTPDALTFVDTGNNQEIIRPYQPVVQLMAHRISYSKADHSIRSKGMGLDTLTWGIQFSYPQLFQDPVTSDIVSVMDSEKFPNTTLFKKIQKWVRHHTLPTPFIVEGQKVNSPMRIGKECLQWVNNHPQLAATGLSIEGRDDQP